jgi:hypothetical protein
MAGFFFVAMQGRIPGGTDTSCERKLAEDISIRIDVYAYQSGLSLFQLQSFYVSENASTWRKLFEDDLHAPRNIDCDNNIVQISENTLLLFNGKTIAISSDKGATWQLSSLCEESLPLKPACDADALNIASIDLEESGQGRILIEESVVDEYGEAQTENGEALVKQEFVFLTSDFGKSWLLEASN